MWERGKSKLDWWTVLLYLLLVAIGWVNIYSASLEENTIGFFSLDHIYFKQLIWIGLSLVIILFVLAIDSKFYLFS